MAQICPRCSEPTGDDSTRCMECGTQLFPNRPSPGQRGARVEKPRAASKLLEPAAERPQSPAGVRLLRAAVEQEAAVPPSPPAVVRAEASLGQEQEPATPPGAANDSAASPEAHVELDPFSAYGDRLAEVEQNLDGMLEHLQADMEEALAHADPSFYIGLDQFAVSSTAHTPDVAGLAVSATAHASLGFEFVPASEVPGWPESTATVIGDPWAADSMSHETEEPGVVAVASVSADSIAAEAAAQAYFPISEDLERNHALQALDVDGQWRDWAPIDPEGLNVGRADSADDFPGLKTLANQHMRFSYELGMLTVEDLGSSNGVYLRITEPVPLVDGIRFRIGGHTLEFREPESWSESAAAVSADGEEFCSRDLAPLAFVDLIRPDGRPGLRFPITQSDETIIGREGPSPHITLADDHAVSTSHAQLRREEGLFYLEDLRSRHGTFVQIRGTSAVSPGDILLAGRVLFRIVRAS